MTEESEFTIPDETSLPCLSASEQERADLLSLNLEPNIKQEGTETISNDQIDYPSPFLISGKPHHESTTSNLLYNGQQPLPIGLLSASLANMDDFVLKKPLPDISGAPVEIDGVHYNSRGYEICGQLNQHSKLCQRIGTCPFHKKPNRKTPPPSPSPGQESPAASSPLQETKRKRDPPIKKQPFKRGWTKEEHILFLKGLKIHGKGAWKEISSIVATRNPTQIQSHAQKYFLRQKQEVKNKRSIHDISLEDLQDIPDRPNPYPKTKPSGMNVNMNMNMNTNMNMNNLPRQLPPYPYHPILPQHHFGLDQNFGMFFTNPMVSHLPPGMSPAPFPIPYATFLPQLYPFPMPITFTLNPEDPRIINELCEDRDAENDFTKTHEEFLGEKRGAPQTCDFFGLVDERSSKRIKENDCDPEILY